MILRLRNIVLQNKIINKTPSTKNQENSAHHFGDNYVTNHLVKFQQHRIKPWRETLKKNYDLLWLRNWLLKLDYEI